MRSRSPRTSTIALSVMEQGKVNTLSLMQSGRERQQETLTSTNNAGDWTEFEAGTEATIEWSGMIGSTAEVRWSPHSRLSEAANGFDCLPSQRSKLIPDRHSASIACGSIDPPLGCISCSAQTRGRRRCFRMTSA